MDNLQKLHSALLPFDQYRIPGGLAKLIMKKGRRFYCEGQEITEKEIALIKKLNPGRESVLAIESTKQNY